MSRGAQIALASIWAVWSLSWGMFWAFTGIGIVITLLCIPVALVPFFFIHNGQQSD